MLRAEALVTTGLTRPVYATAPAGEADKLYIVEQTLSRIRVLDLGTNQLSTFIDLPNSTGSGGERGIKGLAFHPDYATNGKFYVHVFEGDQTINIREYTRSLVNPSVGDPSTERTVLSFDHHPTRVDHTAGWIGFSPIDGNLYIPTGDGGSGTDPSSGLAAQDTTDLRGKVLRIDVDGPDAFPDDDRKNYAIPASNPFASGGGAEEVYAYGLRSPFRGSFDRLTGDLYIGDVGSSRWEEINLSPADSGGGQNFGWRSREGAFPNPTFSGDPPPVDPTDPLYDYRRSTGAAVIGGYVYRGQDIPDLVGDYVFADFRRDDFFSFPSDADPDLNLIDRSFELRNPVVANGSYAGVASLAEDASGELYFLDYFNGDVFKIIEGVAGDYDIDGDVDVDDYALWESSFGSDTDLAADGNRDGVVNAADYTIWRDSLAASETQSIPEPAAGLLTVAACVSLVLGRRRLSSV